ncbi:MAG: hypothetical protein AAF696_14145, partial [Bacteroidota bacterium]
FKVFAQKLFVQTTQYITTAERSRIKELKTQNPPVLYVQYQSRPVPAGYRKRQIGAAFLSSKKSTGSPVFSTNSAKEGIKPLYQAKNWIPMMLGIMRAKKIDISDREVLKYFKSQPYYPDLYKQLTQEEKDAVDQSH